MIAQEKEDRYRKLVQTTRDLAQHIEWLLPFLDKRAKESGDVAGMQINAKEAASSAKKLLHFYETEDAVKARSLAGGRER
jgi:hypothetical protein